MRANLALKPLIVDLARFYGGAEVRVLALARALGPAGCRVACLRGSPLARALRAEGVAPLELTAHKLDPRLGAALASAARSGACDLVDAHNVQSHLWCSVLPTRRGAPALVATVHSSTGREHAGQLKGKIYERIERWTVPRADQVVTVSTDLRGELLGWGIPADRISLVQNGVALEAATPEEGRAARRELGLGAGDFVIGTIARLEPAKGLRHLLEAFALLAPREAAARCVIVGDGRLAPELKAFAAAQGLGGRVTFTGFRTDIPRLLAAFDLYALPSLTEGIPIALLEACMAARPIVASRVGGVPEVLTHDRSALLVEAGDDAALAGALGALMHDPGRARALAAAAAATARERFSLAAMVAGTRQAYAAAVSRREARGR